MKTKNSFDNTKPMAVSFQCMTKSTTNKKKIKIKKKKRFRIPKKVEKKLKKPRKSLSMFYIFLPCILRDEMTIFFSYLSRYQEQCPSNRKN